MKFKINKVTECTDLLELGDALIKRILDNGHELVALAENSNFVLNIIDLDSPKAYNRKSQEEMVISITLISKSLPDTLSICYAALVKSISNMLFCILMPDGSEQLTAFSVTPEVGFTEFAYSPDRLYDYMYPVISSHFVIRNKLSEDLYFNRNELIPEVEDIILYGKELGALGVLPAPFPLTKFLDQDLIDQLFRLYQIKGLSYGNLSIRNVNYKIGGTTFWMTARGVDKSHLKGIGNDLLLVKGYDETNGEMLVSVPREHDPRIRVSVEAIEHYMIYREFPDVGAIVHVHAWIDGVLCTTQTYPCGSSELANNVVDLLKNTANPGRTEVGLKNHGLTITGPDIRDIFHRIKGRLNVNVPMFN